MLRNEISKNRSKERIFFTRATQIFIECAKSSSFTEAATRLEVTQSSVSQVIKQIENELRVTLFERDTRPLRLTRQGELLFKELEESMSRMKSLVSLCRQDYYLRPSLELGMIESSASFVGVRLIDRLSKEVSQTRLAVGLSDKLLHEVINNELEMAVISSPIIQDTTVEWYLLWEEPWILVFPKSFPVKKNISWEELRVCGLPFIHHGAATANEKFFKNLEERLHFRLPRLMELDSNLLMYQFIKGGKGWTITQCHVALPQVDVNEIQVMKVPEPMPKRKVFLVTQKNCDQQLVKTVYSSLSSLMKEQIKQTFSKSFPEIEREFRFYDAYQKEGEFSLSTFI